MKKTIFFLICFFLIISALSVRAGWVRPLNTNNQNCINTIAAPTDYISRWQFLTNANPTPDDTGLNPGGVTNAIWSSEHNGSYAFDGSTTYILVGGDGTLKFTGDLSVSAWVNCSVGSNAGDYHHIFSFYDTSFYGGYAMAIGNEHIQFYTNGGGWQDATTTVCDGNWHNIITALSTSNGKVYYYIDGNSDGNSNSAAATYSQPVNGAIGSTGAGGYIFNGKISDVQIFNRTLTSMEAQQIALNNYSSEMVCTNSTGGTTIINNTIYNVPQNLNITDSPSFNQINITGGTAISFPNIQSEWAFQYAGITTGLYFNAGSGRMEFQYLGNPLWWIDVSGNEGITGNYSANGNIGVTASGTNCTITNITGGIVTGAVCS